MRVTLVRDDVVVPEGEARPANSLPGKQLALIGKLHEEVAQLAKESTDPFGYADLLEAVSELMRINEVSWASVEEASKQKRETSGAFRRGLVWHV